MLRVESMSWRKSSRSDPNNCVEVAWPADKVAVRDSKNPFGPTLRFDRAAFSSALRRL